MHAFDRQTGGRTDGGTDRQTDRQTDRHLSRIASTRSHSMQRGKSTGINLNTQKNDEYMNTKK